MFVVKEVNRSAANACPEPRRSLRSGRVATLALTLPLMLAALVAAQPASRTSQEVPDLGTRRTGVDWPTFLGPTGDSKSTEKGIQKDWNKNGLRIVWQRQLGEGYGIGSVSRGRYFQFDRKGEVAQLLCLNAETGAELWKFEYPTRYEDLYGYNGGPRCSPVVDGDRVYIFGAEGMLYCLRVVDGKQVWKVDTTADFGVVQNFFGVGSTPAIEGDLLIVMVGGSPESSQRVAPGQLDRVEPNGTGIVAFNKYTGKVVYRIADELASYASLKLATLGGRRWGFAFLRGGLVGFDPVRGQIDFHYPWRARLLESVNASTPVVVGDEVFISETYGVGSSLLKVTPGKATPVWVDEARTRQKSFLAHWNTPIHVDGYLYGCSGRNPPDADLRCIEWKTGKVMWSVPNRIRTSLLYVDQHFVSLAEDGVLQLIKVNPKECEVIGELILRDPAAGPDRFGEQRQLLRYPCWAAPILSHGLMYVRGEGRLVCLELIPQTMK